MAKSKDAMSLSFLDVLSCSLGAMILLFLIFSTLNHQGDRASQAREGLDKPGTLMRRSDEAGDKELNVPVLLEVALESLDGTRGTLTFPNNADPWARLTQDQTAQSGTKTTWYVFVEDPSAAEGKEINLQPMAERFRVGIRTLTGFGPPPVDPVVLAGSSDGKARLRFASNALEPRSP